MHKPCAEIELEIPFHDVDILGVAWHGHYTKYFEIARCALLRQLDYDVPQMRDSGYAWPVIDCHLRYVRSARYGQRIVVRATLAGYENRLKIVYEIRDRDSGERLTRGSTVQVAVSIAGGELQFVSPKALVERVEGRRCA